MPSQHGMPFYIRKRGSIFPIQIPSQIIEIVENRIINQPIGKKPFLAILTFLHGITTSTHNKTS